MRRFKDDCADFRPHTNKLERLKRLDRFSDASPADLKLFRQLFFRRQAFARLDLPFSNEIENVINDLGGDGLSSNQADNPPSNVPSEAGCQLPYYSTTKA